MSFYANVTEQDLIVLAKISEQQENQRANTNKIKKLNQTHDEELAESFKPIN